MKGKLVSVKKEEQIKSKDGSKVFTMQECIISDCQAKAYRLVLWESLVNKAEQGKSYYLSNVLVKSYLGQKYFSTTGDSEVRVIDDVGEVCEEEVVKNRKVFGQIVGIASLTEYRSCSMCVGKIADINRYIGNVEQNRSWRGVGKHV